MTGTSDIIEAAWESRAELTPGRIAPEVTEAIEHCIQGLDSGELRVAEYRDGGGTGIWTVNKWEQHSRGTKIIFD